MLKDDRSWIHLVGRGSRMEIQRSRQAALRTDDSKADGLEQVPRHADDRRNHFVAGRQRPKEPEDEFEFRLPSLPQPLAFEEERRQDRIAPGHGKGILFACIRAGWLWGQGYHGNEFVMLPAGMADRKRRKRCEQQKNAPDRSDRGRAGCCLSWPSLSAFPAKLVGRVRRGVLLGVPVVLPDIDAVVMLAQLDLVSGHVLGMFCRGRFDDRFAQDGINVGDAVDGHGEKEGKKWERCRRDAISVRGLS